MERLYSKLEVLVLFLPYRISQILWYLKAIEVVETIVTKEIF